MKFIHKCKDNREFTIGLDYFPSENDPDKKELLFWIDTAEEAITLCVDYDIVDTIGDMIKQMNYRLNHDV